MKFRLPARIGLFRLSLLGVAIGVGAGFGAVVFRALIGLIHNIAFLGRSPSTMTPTSSPPQARWAPLSFWFRLSAA